MQACDSMSTGRVLKAVVQLCFDAGDWEGLNEHIVLLSKRRSQLKTVSYKNKGDQMLNPPLWPLPLLSGCSHNGRRVL